MCSEIQTKEATVSALLIDDGSRCWLFLLNFQYSSSSLIFPCLHLSNSLMEKKIYNIKYNIYIYQPHEVSHLRCQPLAMNFLNQM